MFWDERECSHDLCNKKLLWAVLCKELDQIDLDILQNLDACIIVICLAQMLVVVLHDFHLLVLALVANMLEV